MSRNNLLLVLVLLGLISVAFAKTEAKSEFILSDLPVLKANVIDPYAELPAPTFDTNRIWTGSTSNLLREIKGGKYFKGSQDDTFRLVSVQSGGTRYLVIATDTMTDQFKKHGYRIETPLTYPSGGTAEPVAVGDVDGDEYMDILYGLTASPYRLYWVEWDPTLPAWVYRDSIQVNAAINDITFGDGDNDPLTRDFYFNISQTSPAAAIMRAYWNGTAWDTLRLLTTGFTTATKAVAIGDVDPTFPGNEVYVAQGPNIWQFTYSGGTWTGLGLIGMGYTISDMTIGGGHPLLTGPVIACVLASTTAQVGIVGWTGTTWGGWLWALTLTWATTAGTHDIAIGELYKSNPGPEIVLTCGASTTGNSRVFWVAPNATAWVWPLVKPVASQSEYGVFVSPDINKFNSFTDEFVIACGGAITEYEEHDFVNDVGTYYFTTDNPTAIINASDNINVTIFNDGSAPQSGFTVGYLCRFNPSVSGSVVYTGTLQPGQNDVVTLPVTFNFLGLDTLCVFTSLAGDANQLNDTTKVVINVYPVGTLVGCGFNSTTFPPSRNSSIYPPVPGPNDWTRTIISGTMNWARVASSSYPACTPLEGGGYAHYNNYSASTGSGARLATHRFNIGPDPKDVIVDFYFFQTSSYSTYYDSLFVEYSTNGTTWIRKAAYRCHDPANPGWNKKSVNIGSFPGNTDLWVGFRTWSNYYHQTNIDSVIVTTAPPSAAVNDVGVDRIYGIPRPAFTGTSYTITARIRNYGLGSQPGPIPVSYDPGDGSPVVTETWSGSLAPLDTVLYTFTAQYTPANPSTPDGFLFKAWTDLTGDSDNSNDTTAMTTYICPPYHTPPYYENFDGAWTNSTNPPFCGWTIIDGGSETPPVTNTNDWHRYNNTGTNYVARVYFSPVEYHDDWLISPRFDCSAPGSYVLSFWHDYNDYSTTSPDSGLVLISLDGGETWPYEVARFSNADYSGTMTYDISSIVSGENNVKVAFRYGAHDEFWWYIDDFKIEPLVDAAVTGIIRPYEPTAETNEQKRVTFTPEVEVTNYSNNEYTIPVKAEIWSSPTNVFLTEGFNGTDFPPAGWQAVILNGTYNWQRMESNTFPTCTPYEGAAMASYQSFSASSGSMARLITPAIDLGANPIPVQVKFWMYHDPGFSTNPDSVKVEYSTDGTNFNRVTAFCRYAPTAAWVEHTVDLGTFSGTIYVGFLAYSGFGNNMNIDYVTVGEGPQLLWSDYTKEIVLAGGGISGNVAFDDYTPLAEGNYLFKAWTELPGDQNPANDLMTRVFTVEAIPMELVSPENGAEFQNRTPTFEWNAVPGATDYRIQISNEPFAKEIIIDQVVEGATTFTVSEPGLDDGTYYWHVRVEAPGTPDPYSEPWMFKVDNEPPATPEPMEPTGTISISTPTFSWRKVSDAVLYNLVVTTAKDEVININTEDTTYTPTEPLNDGSYEWKVRAKDLAGNWGDFSEPMGFTISTFPAIPGWAELESMPTLVPGKYVKDGGALTAASEEKTYALFAFRGNKSKEFKKYTVGNPGIWADMETIPFGFKYKVGPPPTVDSARYNKKFPGKGAALCWDGANAIYATKGNGTFELWKYDLDSAHWYFESWIPSTKGAKGGTSLFFKDGLLYVLVGGLKPEFDNFFAYDPVGKSWATLQQAPAGATAKPWKDGSAIVAIGNKIYGIKGGDKYNSFWAYDIGSNNWTEVESCPQNHPSLGKKNKVGDGGAMTTDGSVAYMIKGKGKQDFWMYTPNAIPPDTGLWTPLDTIPRLWKNSVPKTGAALAYANGRVYLLKGNNSPEFWQYGPYKALAVAEIKPTTNSAVMTENSITNLSFNFSVNPNPFNKFTTIRYTVPVSGKVTIKLYNSTGRLIETLTDEYLTAGTYTTRLTAKSLASGIYFLKYEDAKNSSEVKLIVQ